MTQIVYKRLVGENTYSYRKFEVPLQDQGLTFVRGLNVDDGGFLGAGKSSLFEAFSVLQMGKGGKSTNLSDMVNHAAGKDMQTTLYLSIDGVDHKIVLSQQHSRYGSGTRVIDMDTGRNIIPSNTHAAKYIREEILKVGKTTFFHLQYLAQRMTNVLLTGTDAQRKHQITEMFDLNVYDKLAKYMEGQIKLADTELRHLEGLEAEMLELDGILADNPTAKKLRTLLQKREDLLHAKQVALEAAIDQLQEKEGELKDAERRRAYLQEIREMWADTPSLQKDLAKPTKCTKKYLQKVENVLKAARDVYADLRSSLRTLDQRDILQAQLDKLSDEEINATELNEELTDVKSRLSNLQNIELPQAEARQEILQEMRQLDLPEDEEDLGECRKTLDDLKEEKTLLSSEIKDAKTQLEGDRCPQCKRPYSHSVEEINTIKNLLKKKRGRLSSVSQEVHRLERVVDSLETYSSLQARLEGITTKRKVAAVQTEINHLTARERDLTVRLDSSQRREAIVNQLKSMPTGNAASLRKKRRKAKSKVERLENKLEAAKTIRSNILRVKKLKKVTRKKVAREIERTREVIHQLTGKISSLTEKVVIAKNQLASVTDAKARKAKLDRKLKEVRELVDQAECYKALKVAFGQKGLKHDRLHSIMKEAAEETVPLYTEALWPNRNVVLELEPTESAIRFQLSRQGGYETSSRAISGGESHKAGLAFLFGLRDLKEIYTDYSGNVLILDEPFSHLDPQGKLALLKVLHMLKSRFSSIFVIDHSTGVANSEIWDQVWWAVRENHESTLYRGDPPERYLQLARRYEEELTH
jgi:DNA repair exonuclease SbcCD ATPase subunit